MAVSIASVNIIECQQTPTIRRAAEQVATSIAPDHAWWLADLLFEFSQELLHREQVERKRETRANTRKLLQRRRNDIVALLNNMKLISEFSHTDLTDCSAVLHKLNIAIGEAAQSARLVASRGHALLSPTKALPPGDLPTKYYYAALIAEVYAFFNNESEIPPASVRGASWAEALLKATDDGKRKDRSWEKNNFKGWRRYFAEVQRPELKGWRGEVRRRVSLVKRD